MLKEEIRHLHGLAGGAQALQRRFQSLPALCPPGAAVCATQQLIIGGRGLLHRSGPLIAMRQVQQCFRRSRIRAPSFHDRAIGILHVCFRCAAESLLFSQLPQPKQGPQFPFCFRMGKRGSLYGIGIAIMLAAVFLLTFSATNALGGIGAMPPFLAAWAWISRRELDNVRKQVWADYESSA